MNRRLWRSLGLSLAVGAAAHGAMGAAREPGAPAAVLADPPIDRAHPASTQGVQFTSHGAVLNALLYRPAGAGAHPTAVLLHGLPGNEGNLDLAQAMRRAGWTVITFHYRGAWGSGGTYTLSNGVEDAKALMAELHRPERAKAWGVDPGRIVLVGHSYGGYVAAATLAGAPDALGAVLLAPWDIHYDQRAWSALPEDKRKAIPDVAFDDVNGRLTGADSASLFDEVMREGQDLDLAGLAPQLAGRRLLILSAVHDDPDDQADALVAGLKQAGAAKLRARRFDTDHAFSDHRIAMEAEVLRWLAKLPGAPR